jgi:hypothetical protein
MGIPLRKRITISGNGEWNGIVIHILQFGDKTYGLNGIEPRLLK